MQFKRVKKDRNTAKPKEQTSEDNMTPVVSALDIAPFHHLNELQEEDSFQTELETPKGKQVEKNLIYSNESFKLTLPE